MDVIAFAGADEAGKSTLAKQFASALSSVGYNVAIKSFATALREELIANGTLERDEAYAKPTSAYTRRILTEFATARRAENASYWAEKLFEDDLSEYDIIIIDDQRYVNEWVTIQGNSNNNVAIFIGESEDKHELGELADIYADFNIKAKPTISDQMVLYSKVCHLLNL